MQIKIIYEDPQISAIHDAIINLETDQFYFVERYIAQERYNRQEAVFRQWQQFLANTVDYTCIRS